MAHKVLVVEDFQPVQNLYVDVLTRCQMDTIRADDGEQALRLINTEKPDIVLLDVDLPRLSGLEVLKRTRENVTTCDTPIIIITGNRGVEHRDTMIDADLVLIKPVSPTDIVNFVQRFLPNCNKA